MGAELSAPLPQKEQQQQQPQQPPQQPSQQQPSQQPPPQKEEQSQEQQEKVIFERYVEPEGTKIEVEPTEVAMSYEIVKKKEKTKVSNKSKTQ